MKRSVPKAPTFRRVEPRFTPREELSFGLGERLRQLRNEKGLSYPALAAELKKHYDISISKDSLMNYEIAEATHSKAKNLPNLGMKLEYLYCLADYYKVSIDWLVGNTDFRGFSAAEQSAESLGLPESFVSFVQALSQSDKNGEFELVKKIFESWSFLRALGTVCQFAWTPRSENSKKLDINERNQLFSRSLELQNDVLGETDGAYTVCSVEAARNGILFTAQRLFTTAIEETVENFKQSHSCSEEDE